MLVLRLLLAPLTVLGVAIAQRRLGPTVGGHLLGLPLTAASFLLLFGLQSGQAAARAAADAAAVGLLSTAAFCLWYGGFAARRRRRSGGPAASDEPASAPAAARSSLVGGLLAAVAGAFIAVALRDVPSWWTALLLAGLGLGSAAVLAPGDSAGSTATQPVAAWASRTLVRMGSPRRSSPRCSGCRS